MAIHVKGTPFSRTRRDFYSSTWGETSRLRVRPEGMSRTEWRSLTSAERKAIRKERQYTTGKPTTLTKETN